MIAIAADRTFGFLDVVTHYSGPRFAAREAQIILTVHCKMQATSAETTAL